MLPGFIGRVPVYDRALNLFAYELRPCSLTVENGTASEARLQELWQSLRLERLTGGHPGLVPFTPALEAQLQAHAWPKEAVIVTLPGELLDRYPRETLQHWSKEGYVLAVRHDHYDATLAADLEFARLWAMDASHLEEFIPHLEAIHQHGLELLVRDIETRQQYDRAFDAGCDYFQGHYFECPRFIHGTHLPANRLAVLHLIARLNDPDIRIEEVETLVSQDMTLSYKLLRLINSAFYGLPKQVDSIRRAVVFLGLDRIRHWAIVIAVNAIDYKPRELLVTALVRAQTCARIAERLERSDVEACHIAGLFSLLDAIMDAPMTEILANLSLAEEIEQALLYGTGPIGPILQTALQLENGLCHKIPLPDLDLSQAMSAYLEAIEEAEAVRRVLENQNNGGAA
ncbi:c-di-GMP phosphodiesterase [Methylomarinovum tepidoasis]|uniref:C-di-GMP phosphodiesterase n=1 Tax=Methylomarinovum tepidoasis TaxID=2840183 RepID=A0AAU9CGQ9_9GAMM|nr:HDOD domain-containing protein [Methylomarinovum sp. IN45]BCX89438.1 c-di-GMP phosphodiesterase [Methylomarinovum sp. IN45]